MKNSNILKAYFKEISKYPLLTKEEEEDLILRAQFGEKVAQDKLVVSNLRFVVTIAKKFLVPGVDLEDCIQEGNIGLIKSIQKFNPLKGVKFISYAIWWIRAEIYSFINENSRTIRLALNQIRDNSEYRKLKEIAVIQASDDGAEPDNSDYLEHVPISLDKLDGDLSIIEIIPNPEVEDPDRKLITDSLITDIKHLLNTLEPREKEILELYYGIGRERPLTLDECGDKLNLTRERVRQIKALVLNRLSLKSKYARLARYLE